MTFDEERRTGIGSTDSAAILGISPWKSAHDVWRQKVHGEPSKDPSLPMWLGTELEGAIGKLYTAETGQPVYRDETLYRQGVLIAHVDFRWLYVGDDQQHRIFPHSPIVEAKTQRSKRGWGESGSTQIPRHYWIQVQHQMAVTLLPFVDVAVLFGHEDFRIYRIQRDDAFIESLIADMTEWWELYVATETPPPVDGSEGSSRWLREAYPVSTEDVIPATADHVELVGELFTLREAAAALARADELIVQKLKDVIKEHEGMNGSTFSIRWKSNKSRVNVDWEAVAHAQRLLLMEAPDYNAAYVDSIVAQFTEIKPGNRPFVVEFNEGANDE